MRQSDSVIQEVWRLPFGLAIFTSICLSLFTINALEWAIAGAVFFFGLKKILVTNSIPVHLSFVFPFLEIVTSLLDAELSDARISDHFYGTGQVVFLASMVSLAAVFFCWERGSRGLSNQSVTSLNEIVAQFSLTRLILSYLAVSTIVEFVKAVIPYGSSLAQLEKHFAMIPSIMLGVVMWSFFAKPRLRLQFYLFLLLVFLSSLFSYFSQWKELFILLGFILIIRDRQPTGKVLRRLGISFAALSVFVLTWQAVKSEYRMFLSGGERAQRIVVDQAEATQKLLSLANQFWFDPDARSEEWYGVKDSEVALQSTIERVGYLDLFARMAQYVPEEIEHERGKMLIENLNFALVPRILNPNKGRKNDQIKVEKYAKRNVADNASFSLGHYAEHFIDFGPIGMIFSLGIYGMLIGWVCRKLTERGSGAMLIADSIACFIIMKTMVSFQFDAIKIYGQAFWASITYLMIFRRVIKVILSYCSGEATMSNQA